MGGGVFVGRVVSNRMQKTVVVAVNYVVWVPRYKVYEKRVGRHMAHDEQQECVVGDLVKIVSASRKLSKHKSYRVAQILRRMPVYSAATAAATAEQRAQAQVPSMEDAMRARLEAARKRLQEVRQLYEDAAAKQAQALPGPQQGEGQGQAPGAGNADKPAQGRARIRDVRRSSNSTSSTSSTSSSSGGSSGSGSSGSSSGSGSISGGPANSFSSTPRTYSTVAAVQWVTKPAAHTSSSLQPHALSGLSFAASGLAGSILSR